MFKEEANNKCVFFYAFTAERSQRVSRLTIVSGPWMRTLATNTPARKMSSKPSDTIFWKMLSADIMLASFATGKQASFFLSFFCFTHAHLRVLFPPRLLGFFEVWIAPSQSLDFFFYFSRGLIVKSYALRCTQRSFFFELVSTGNVKSIAANYLLILLKSRPTISQRFRLYHSKLFPY